MVAPETSRRPIDPDFPVRTDRLWTLLLGGMAILVAALYAYPLSHLTSAMSFNYSEGWNAYRQEAAQLGHTLYAAPPDLTIANYPPVSFHLVGWAGPLFGGVTMAGRVVGLFCLAWSALNVAAAAAMTSGSRPDARWRDGAFAALCLLLWVALLAPGRIATNDPSFLGLALSTMGVCAYLRAGGRAGWIIAAAVAFATALFVKNNLLAFPVAAGLHLVLTRRLRSLALFVAAGMLMAGLLLSLTVAVDGPFFLNHLRALRVLSRQDGIASLTAFGTYFAVPVLIGTGWLLWSAGRGTGIVALCLGCAAGFATGFAFGNGVAYNIYFETLAALAVAASGAVSAVERSVTALRRGWIPVAVVALSMVAPVLVRAPVELYGALGRAGRQKQLEADYVAGVALIRSRSGAALCESLLMCFEAGKPFEADPYFVKDQIRIGRIAESQVIADLEARRFASIEIGEDDPAFTLGEGERLRFTADTVTALQANYRVAFRGASFAVLVPR